MERVAIIGASRGLGLCLAQVANNSNQELVLFSRNIGKSKAKELSVKNCSIDFAKMENLATVKEILTVNEVQRIFYVAGGGPYGGFAEKKWEDHQWALNLNFLFPAQLLHWAMKRELSQFVMVGSSIAEDKADPLASSYAASKHAMCGLITSIQAEEPSKFDVRLFSPGYMDTSMLPPNSEPRKNSSKILKPLEVAQKLWDWANTDAKNIDMHLRVE